MKSNLTAIEWLQSIEMERDLNLGDWAKAKEMEKQQIAEAYYIGDKNGCGCYDYCTKEDSEQYYKETYEI